MRKMKISLAIAALSFSLTTTSFGMGHEVFNTDNFNLNIGGRIQEVAYAELLHDPIQSKDNLRAYLFLKQARFNMNGRVQGTKYNMEWVGAAEDINGSNNGTTLLDFSFDVPLFNWDSTWLKVGQYKVPYGRESLNDDGAFVFVDRSINYGAFNLGRDVGAAVHTYKGKFAGVFGVFTGGARDVPLRFLPEHLGVPMVVGRIGYNDGLDKDIYSGDQIDFNPQRLTKATYINGMYMKDTRIGHSTVINVRALEKSILLNSNWNPYVAQTPYDRASFWQMGWDGALRGPLGNQSAWSAEAEANYASFKNKYGHLDLAGIRAQAGITKKKIGAALRYAVLYPDNQFMKTTTRVTGTQPYHEINPSFTYYMRGHDAKIVLDFPTYINVPIFIENAAGSYVSVEQPDQASVIVPATGRVERQTVGEARIMYQLAF